ncbi:pyrroline-5-carboxylate reductase [Ectothiorhodosinus mongolicus]|uniref:Pyrroline-5-carboxylate reductase n=1 Tax=Ectothiorhodosinus mongolicus TaxID=233100 RepID=A0A1R3VYI5_9GAMM|nr:pyrroline-5-carboxylate reductase [Ectothiorhodosinus mongolicus]ULX57139.1 pyrroline-5-carboxylate reductase [Ectothiorhodosinus mongolicus]SIT70097.1 pyrroline-5-carboxylate reductase [Ectothiorhodosinus mongolicus]
MKPRIAFIGSGNMARSLIGGLIVDGWPASSLCASDPDAQQRQHLLERWPELRVTANNETALDQADVLVLAIKPQVMAEVCLPLAKTVQKNRPLILSIAAGVRSADIDRWLGGQLAVVRSMPNTPALVGSGATGLVRNTQVTDAQRDLAESILRAVGMTVWLDDETLLDAVTALSGSGPAYVFLFIEALQEAGIELGLPPETAALLALETVFGAAKLALEADEDAGQLRQRVTSPGGTTERAIAVLEKGGLRPLLAKALASAKDRAGELADQLGRQ